jgi:type II secretory pathway predicted ATPase ExeA
VIEKLQSHYGFTRTPFGRSLAPQMLHRHGTHAEAVARIGWCITERALGVVTGEVGAGKTVAVRAALAAVDASRHTLIYLGNPAVGGRGLYHGIVTALGGVPRFHKAALIPQTADLLAAEDHERGRTVVLVLDEAHLLDADWRASHFPDIGPHRVPSGMEDTKCRDGVGVSLRSSRTRR